MGTGILNEKQYAHISLYIYLHPLISTCSKRIVQEMSQTLCIWSDGIGIYTHMVRTVHVRSEIPIWSGTCMLDFLMKMGQERFYFPEVPKKQFWVERLKVGR